jgi:hypothetical protein
LDYVPGDFKLVDGNQIVVTFPHGTAFPLALVFDLTLKVVSDDVSLGTRTIDGGGEEEEGKGSEKKVKFNVKGEKNLLFLRLEVAS